MPLLESFPPSRNTEQVTSDLGGHFIDSPASQLPSILGTPTTVVPAAQPQRAAGPVSGTPDPGRAEWLGGARDARSLVLGWGVVGARPARRRLKSTSASGRKMSLSASVSSGPSTHWSRGFR